jgi:triosephosphate isomerase (TIM)
MTAPRAPLLAGNWKMNLGPADAARFLADFLPLCAPAGDRQVAFFPPALSLASAAAALAGRPDIRLGVQNVHWEASGAFTGELSVAMAAEAGASMALVGHSERRHLFGETVAETARKVRAVLDGGLVPVLCVGETHDERRGGSADEVVVAQLRPALDDLSPADADRLVVAYEPVWAIGTGVTATPDDAESMHRTVRGALAERFGVERGGRIPILYGGSVKPENAGELMTRPGIDGVLVGGASLDAAVFARIVAASG